MVDRAPFGEDDEGARLITHPRHLEPGRGHRTPVPDLHPGVRRVECDAVVEVESREMLGVMPPQVSPSPQYPWLDTNA